MLRNFGYGPDKCFSSQCNKKRAEPRWIPLADSPGQSGGFLFAVKGRVDRIHVFLIHPFGGEAKCFAETIKVKSNPSSPPKDRGVKSSM